DPARGHLVAQGYEAEGPVTRVLTLDGAEITGDRVILDGLDARLRDIRTGPDGALWALTDATPGKVLRITPKP
ncbi:MAG: PQQ-dependent sugar dehydrogenase, partial [Wenzhouxiangellaceae bacterium]